MKRAELTRTSRDIEPFEFERFGSLCDEFGRGWNRVLPESVRLNTNLFQIVNRTFDLQEIGRTHRVLVEGLCDYYGEQNAVRIPLSHRRHVSGFVVNADRIWDQALEASSNCFLRFHIPSEWNLPSTEADRSAQHVLQDLEAMLAEEDEPDFLHKPTRHAYDLARQIIEGAYTHFIGPAPTPTVAPDGEGGIIVEWKSGQCVVRLITPASESKRSYIYSRATDHSRIDRSASALILAKQLRSIFAN